MEIPFEVVEVLAKRASCCAVDAARFDDRFPELDEASFALGLDEIVDESVGLEIRERRGVR